MDPGQRNLAILQAYFWTCVELKHVEMVAMDITRTPFVEFKILRIWDVSLSGDLTKSRQLQPIHYVQTLHQKHIFLGFSILVQWKPHYHYPTLTDTSGYLQSCVPNEKIPGTLGFGATSVFVLHQIQKFQELLDLVQTKVQTFSGAVQSLPRTKHGGLQADCYGGSGGRSPQWTKTSSSLPSCARD